MRRMLVSRRKQYLAPAAVQESHAGLAISVSLAYPSTNARKDMYMSLTYSKEGDARHETSIVGASELIVDLSCVTSSLRHRSANTADLVLGRHVGAEFDLEGSGCPGKRRN